MPAVVGIDRNSGSRASVALTTAESTTPKIDFRTYSAGLIHLPSTSTAVTVTYYASPTESGDYAALYDANATVVTQTIVAGAKSIALPDALFPAAWIKITLDVSATVNFSFK